MLSGHTVQTCRTIRQPNSKHKTIWPVLRSRGGTVVACYLRESLASYIQQEKVAWGEPASNNFILRACSKTSRYLFDIEGLNCFWVVFTGHFKPIFWQSEKVTKLEIKMRYGWLMRVAFHIKQFVCSKINDRKWIFISHNCEEILSNAKLCSSYIRVKLKFSFQSQHSRANTTFACSDLIQLTCVD